MIRIFLGNVGSGKTISAVKELVENSQNPHALPTFSNIITKKKGTYAIPNNIMITRDMLIQKELIKVTKSGEEQFKLIFNKDYWVKAKERYNGFNVVLDEAHTLIDARRFMSSQNKVMNDFLALIRKVCQNPNSDATLTLISQLDSRIDVNARELATEVRYHVGLYDKVCNRCTAYWSEHSDLSDFKKLKVCPHCGYYSLRKCNHSVLVHFFANMEQYRLWRYSGINTILQTIQVPDVSAYFAYYDTYQLDNLISEET